MLSPAFAWLRLYSGPLRLEVMDEAAAEALSLRSRPEDIFRDPTVSYRFAWLGGSPEEFLAVQHELIRALPTRPSTRWCVKFVAWRGEELIGCIDLRRGERFSTGSYVLAEHQGQGLGTRMRLMVADFAVRHLDAPALYSLTQSGNSASEAVSRRCGYARVGVEPNGATLWCLSPEHLPPTHTRAYHVRGAAELLR
ncbi:GNAT family N-acetyltransferase [Corynebacterium uropygiale]|uniref:GNAT family N-acetyltransferase n=1 Tax=Corynebacterium uropygiale TaxID=1775911 RepID=A0A9X1QRT9_9CORY|nr:GNAT family protein [Corynebacterium uropygiale]MCF4007217.1 GNAT family N-acetyltransferase [Corynebacterium uropygiale]